MASTQSINPKAWRKLLRGLKQDPKFVEYLTRGDSLMNLARVREAFENEFDRKPDGISRAHRPRGMTKRTANWAR